MTEGGITPLGGSRESFLICLCVSGISSTRRLEEATFYFRAASTSPQPLRGHTGQNSVTEYSPRKVVLRHSASKRGHGDGVEPAKVTRTEASILGKLSSPEGVLDGGHGGVGRGQGGEVADLAAAVYAGSGGRHGENIRNDVERPLEERRRRRGSIMWMQLQSAREKQRPGTKDDHGETEETPEMDGGCRSCPVTGQSRYNGSLRRMSSSQGKLLANGASAKHIKNWGSFRIPKRSDRTAGGEPEELEGQDFAHSPPVSSIEVNSTPATTSPPIRTRLRTGTESRGFSPEAEHSQVEQKKRCHTQRLRSHDPITQRYGSEVLRRGVLAS